MLMTLKKNISETSTFEQRTIFLIQMNLLVPSRLPQRLLGQIVKAPCSQRQYCLNTAMRLNQLSSTRTIQNLIEKNITQAFMTYC